VVVAETGLLKSKFKYLTNYKGLNFYTESSEPIDLPGRGNCNQTSGGVFILRGHHTSMEETEIAVRRGIRSSLQGVIINLALSIVKWVAKA
jgi:hypothetical protein